MSRFDDSSKPTILSLITLISFLLSVFDVAWFVITTAALLGMAAFSFLGGPIAGGAVTFIVGIVLAISFVRFFLSLLLFKAAWSTWQGSPDGRVYHRRWAWITIALDLLALMLTAGMSPASWWGLIYAIAVLYVMDLPEVRAYFARRAFAPPSKSPGILDDTF
jgi:hypothetical protein